MAPSFAPSAQAGVFDDHHNQIGSGLKMRIEEEPNGFSCSPGGGEYGGSRRRFVVKGHWKPLEDVKLRQLVALHGPRNWNVISAQLPGRSGKSCRLRWVNQLDPSIKKTAFSRDEEDVLKTAHDMFGNQWSHIAKFLPGRTDNSIKNHWHVLNSRRRRIITGAPLLRRRSGDSTNGSTGSTVTLLGKSTVISEGTSLSCTNTPRSVFREEEIKRALVVADDGGNGCYNSPTEIGGGFTAEAGASMPSTARFSLIHPSPSTVLYDNSNPNTATSHFTITPTIFPPSPPPRPPFIDFLGVGE